MPIRLESLDSSEKVHVAVKHDATWAMTAAALKQKRGNFSWPLVVRKADGSYAAVRFQAVVEAGEIPPDTLAEALPGLAPVEAVEMNSISTGTAWDKVNASKTRLLVVTKAGKFAGTMAEGVIRGDGGLPTTKLDQLAGGVVDLSKLSSFLLDEA